MKLRRLKVSMAAIFPSWNPTLSQREHRDELLRGFPDFSLRIHKREISLHKIEDRDIGRASRLQGGHFPDLVDGARGSDRCQFYDFLERESEMQELRHCGGKRSEERRVGT